MRRVWRRMAASLAVVLGALACGDGNRLPFIGGAPDTSLGAVPSAHVIRTHPRAELTENSGAAMSSKQGDVLFTINDSGHKPELFALDTTGTDRGVWRIGGASNGDWEAIALGSCTTVTGTKCLFIGDVGDNEARRRSVSIYEVPEPGAGAPGFVGLIRARRLRFTYEDHPHDVEGMFVAPDGAIALITKRRLLDSVGRTRPALIYSLPRALWTDTIAVARLVDSLPVDSAARPMLGITDAALSLDSRYLAVRTSHRVVVFAVDTITARIRRDIQPAKCNIAPLKEWQGEGMTWLGKDGRLLLTSEGRREPLRIVRCPLPG